jgi:AraC-like DNA-binding protein
MLEHQKHVASARIRERSFWLPLIGQALHHYGLASEGVVASASLPADAQVSGEYIDQASCSLFWAEAVQLAEDDLLGMRLSRLCLPTPFGALALTAQASPSISSALMQLTRFLGVVSTQVRLTSQPPQGVRMVLQLLPQGQVHAQHMEAVLGYLAWLLNQLDQRGEELLLGVTLPAHRAVQSAEECARLLGCQQVERGEGYALHINAALLDRTLATADAFLFPRLVDTLQDLLASVPTDDLVEQVKRRIQLLLSTGDISEDRVAAPLNISPRHLRRKLNQDGTSYEQLVDEVRRESAVRLITEGQLSLTSIAYELGFLDPSSFTRAFRRWTDMSPTAFRRQVSLQG